jgi:long-chain acyl-CoA synthetase
MAAERAEIEQVIAGKTLCAIFAETASRLEELNALKWRTSSGWKALSWRAYREAVRDFSLGLSALGFHRGSRAVLLTHNRPEHLIASHGVVHALGVPVSLYRELSSEQIGSITAQCGASVAVVEPALLPRLLAVRSQLSALEHVVLLGSAGREAREDSVVRWESILGMGRLAHARDPGAFDRATASARPDDLAAIVYTSGTSRASKGVMITHRNALFQVTSGMSLAPLGTQDRLLSYAPLAHVSEHLMSLWVHVSRGTTVHLCGEPGDLLSAMREVRPTFFFGPPAIWQMLRSAMTAQTIQETGRGDADAKVLVGVGLDQCRIAASAAAPIAPELLQFFHELGLRVSEAWGMTELGGLGTWNVTDVQAGSVGPMIPGVEGRIAPDGELFVRGGSVMAGYYGDAKGTGEALGPDGWLHTGDVAEVDDRGHYRIIDRKKDIIIPSHGINVSPAKLENLLQAVPLIARACVVGDGRPYVAALIAMDVRAAPARAAGAEPTPAALARDPDLCREIQTGIDEVNRRVSGAEQIRAFRVVPSGWSIDTGELTPTLKVKRRVIVEKYAHEIAAMYAESHN